MQETAAEHSHPVGLEQEAVLTIMPETRDSADRQQNFSARYSDGTYANHYPDWHLEDAAHKAALVRGIIARNAISFQTLCDVGCGAGGVLHELSRALPGRQYIGCDPAAEAIRIAKDCHAGSGIDFQVAHYVGQVTEPIDVITCLDVFEHIPDQLAFLEALRPMATFKIFHIPLELSVNWLLRSRLIAERRVIPGHLHYYTKPIALQVLKETGYTVLDCKLSRIRRRSASVRSFAGNVLRSTIARFSEEKAALLIGGYSLVVLAQ